MSCILSGIFIVMNIGNLNIIVLWFLRQFVSRNNYWLKPFGSPCDCGQSMSRCPMVQRWRDTRLSIGSFHWKLSRSCNVLSSYTKDGHALRFHRRFKADNTANMKVGEDKLGPKDELDSDSFDSKESKIGQVFGRILMFVATQQHGHGMTTGKTGGG